MKKLSKILLAPLPIVGCLPTMVLATSCNDIDYSSALEWYKEELAKAQEAFNASSASSDANLKNGLENIATIEQKFIENKVSFYWRQAVINFRLERYGNEESKIDKQWKIYFGYAGDERKNIYEPYKAERQAEGKWLDLVAGVDAYFENCGKKVAFYQLMSVLNGSISEKGEPLKDLVGWSAHIIWETHNVLRKLDPEIIVPDSDWNADIDGSNIGYIYENMNTPYKSPTLALYKYYTELTDHDSRLKFFRDNILKLDASWDEGQILDYLSSRMVNNYYLIFYTQEFTDVDVSKDEHLAALCDRISVFLKRIKAIQ